MLKFVALERCQQSRSRIWMSLTFNSFLHFYNCYYKICVCVIGPEYRQIETLWLCRFQRGRKCWWNNESFSSWNSWCWGNYVYYQSLLWVEQKHYSLLRSGAKLKGVWGGDTPEVKSGGGHPEVKSGGGDSKRNVIDKAIVCNTQGKEQDVW